MGIAECFELGWCDGEPMSVSFRGSRVVLACDDQDLEALPAERSDFADGAVHVFVDVVAVDDGVDFEFDAVLDAELAELREGFEMSAFTSADPDVGVLVEGVTGYGHDV